MRIIDLSYHSSYLDLTPEAYLKKAESNIGYSHFLKGDHEVIFIFHAAYNKRLSIDGVTYIFRKKHINSKWLIPLSLTISISRMQPDVILVHAMIYIHFAAFLKLFLPSKTQIFIQNHAEITPDSVIKKTVIKLSSKAIKGYLFTSRELAKPWIEKGLIASEKVYELMEGSSSFRLKDKGTSRSALCIPNDKIFIWVGRLDANKDPICALKAFHKYAMDGHVFKLYMFYHTEELLEKIQAYIHTHNLARSIVLKGYLPHEDLELWYNAADFFVSASHSEGSGYALCEAMACGCVPIITSIPSFRYITDDGTSGFLFEPGNAIALYQILLKCTNLEIEEMKNRVLKTFEERLSFEAIASRMALIFRSEK